VVRALWLARLRTVAVVVVALAVAAGGAGMAARRMLADPPAEAPAPGPQAEPQRGAVPARPPAEAKVGAAEMRAREAVGTLLGTEDFEKLRLLPRRWRDWPQEDQKKLIVELLKRLRSPRELRLVNYADMFVPSRVQAGKMAFHGHGLLLDQDVFLDNGRCAWAIEELLGCHLPVFTEEVAGRQQALEEQARAACYRVIETMSLPKERPGKAAP
jgi:hypothetical protein